MGTSNINYLRRKQRISGLDSIYQKLLKESKVTKVAIGDNEEQKLLHSVEEVINNLKNHINAQLEVGQTSDHLLVKINTMIVRDQREQQRAQRDTSYKDRTSINGIEISIAWDEGYDGYTIYFPQIDTDVGFERGVADQILRISDNVEHARKVYEYAIQLASTVPDVYDLYHLI